MSSRRAEILSVLFPVEASGTSHNSLLNNKNVLNASNTEARRNSTTFLLLPTTKICITLQAHSSQRVFYTLSQVILWRCHYYLRLTDKRRLRTRKWLAQEFWQLMLLLFTLDPHPESSEHTLLNCSILLNYRYPEFKFTKTLYPICFNRIDGEGGNRGNNITNY